MTGFNRFIHDRSGAISIIGALSIFMLLALAAIVIDVGHLYFMRRDLQATTDAAALAAVENPANAYAVAMDVFTRNGYGDETLSVTTGSYAADETLSVGDRFTPAGADSSDAVRVHATRDQNNYLASIFGRGSSTLATEATAARVPTISFGAGTRLASLNAGAINSLLSAMFGSSVSLSLIDYQALVNTNVDAVSFLDVLASEANVSGSYEQLASSQVTASQIMTAAAATANSSDGASGDVVQGQFALQSLQSELPNSQPVMLSDVMDISPFYGRTIGNIAKEGTAPQFNLFNLLSASARTVSQNQLINLGTALTIPVTNSSVTAKLTIGAPFAQVSNGKVGSSVQTAQIRLALTATVTNVNLGVATATVRVPLYLEGAYGKATVARLPCLTGDTLAEIEATSGAASLQFGTVADAALKDFGAPVTPVASPIIGISLLGIPIQVNASGSATAVSHGAETLTFSQDEIDAGTIKSVPSSATSPFSTLSSGLTLNSSILGNPGLLAGALNTQVNNLLGSLKPVVSNVIAQLDAPVSNTLASLGITLGMIDVRVFSASCRTPALVE